PNVSGRVVRNGCDRLANGLTSIPTRCFPENYIHANPRLGTRTVCANLADSNYHSLQTQIVLRPIHGISSETTYTWSKLLGDMPGGWNDPLHRRLDYTMPFQNATHDFRFNSVLELPIGPNKFLLGNSSGWLARVVERWQTGLIFNWASGNPRTVPAGATTYAGGQNTLDVGQRRAMIVSPLYNPSMSGHVQWKGDSGLYYGDNWVRVVDPQCQVMNVTDSMGYNLFTDNCCDVHEAALTHSMGYNLFTDNRCDLSALALKNGDGTTGPILLQNPLPGQMGNHPLSLSENGKWRFDANLSKTFRISESKSVQIRFDAVNVLNHPDLTQVEPLTVVLGNINADTQEFGRILTKQGLGAGSAPRSFNGSIRINF